MVAPLRWVETPTGLAVIVRQRPTAWLIRHASTRGGYQWVRATSVRRRADLDGHWPEPAWLRAARASPRPPAVLSGLLQGLAPDEPDPPVVTRPDPDFDTDANGRPQERCA